MGSTGTVEQVRPITRRLLDRGYQVICTTGAGKPDLWPEESDFHAVRYAPGRALCAAADVVLCHAGNGTIYQALSEGTPVVGVPEFHDQEFNMQRIEAMGLGRRARSGKKLPEHVDSAVRAVLETPSYAHRAAAAQRRLNECNATLEAARSIDGLLRHGAATSDVRRGPWADRVLPGPSPASGA
jgi:UDP:flavonoid glycosyltransferase YjiC (YdhE family)